jgi:Tfp pilus assembly protein PilW
MIARIRERLAREDGYSLVELLTVCTIMVVIIGALTTLFVGASKGELDMNRRFQAQENARLAIEKLRREIHCASAVSPTGASSSITLTIPAQCPTAQGFTTISWCVLAPPAAPTGQYALYRSTAATCTTANGVTWADYLTTTTIFNYTAQSSQSLANLGVTLVVNLRHDSAQGTFRLNDDIVLRNSARVCIVGSPVPPC